MNPREAQQEVYKSLLNTADKSSKALKEVFDNIRQAMENLLRSAYSDNQQLKLDIAQSLTNPQLAQRADESVRPMVENLQNIHRELAEANDEMIKLRSKITLLQGRAETADPKMKAALETQLNQLSELNQKYTKTYQQVYKEAQTLAVTMGDSKFAEPGQKDKLDSTLKTLYVQAAELKQQAKQKAQVVKEVEDTYKPQSPGMK
ncbi:hypothetical protein AQUSIP_03460 [Aquicella siphonis]|uniref:Uncharacterized protein n=1 Tax=Aquicella siphonis TaxID=254247 RepID=A0A5E4PDQ4_9COXI|nr:hypothetical protein [Aquicella siphonis]VVC75070.1 hypothetical protein AQUSIP_03460 [Aquicella siphonis]